MNNNIFSKKMTRLTKRVGAMTLAATLALSVPTIANVVSQVSPGDSLEVPVAHAQETENLMIVNETLTTFHVNHNDDKKHWNHSLQNDGEMSANGPEFDLTDLTYVVKLPDELSHLLDDQYVTDYLLGNVLNFDATQSPFTITGEVIDENDEVITIVKDEHKPYEHISVNKNTNSIEFDFTSFYTDNNLEPYIRQNVEGEYFFSSLGITTPIIVPDSRILDNGTYEFKSAIVRGKSIDLDTVSNAYSENLVVDYSTDPEPDPEPEVDKSDLEAALADVEDYDSEDYTEESYATLTSAIEAAEGVLANEEATQEDVNNALATLNNAIESLVEIEEPEEPEVDTTDLEALIEDADGYNSEDFTEASFARFISALEEANNVLENEEATQEDVDQAQASLQEAIDGLEEAEEEVNTAALITLIEEASNLNAEDYTAESYADVLSAIEVANNVLANEEATQGEVDAAVDTLENMIDRLVEIEETTDPAPEPEVETGELVDLVDEAKGYKAADYTSESFASLTSTLEAAKTVLGNDEATQEEVDFALASLEDAIDALEKDVTIIEDDADEEVTVGTEDGEGQELPKTATSTFNMMLVGFLALMTGGTSLLIRRKKKLN